MSKDMQYEMAKMKVGDRIAQMELEIMRVPNGWIFYRWAKVWDKVEMKEMIDYSTPPSGVFVPDVKMLRRRDEPKMNIVVPKM